MPEICRFFGIIIRMYYDEHNPPHLHADYNGNQAVFDFNGNMTAGNLYSRTAVKLVREWIDLRVHELEAGWENARNFRELKKIAPLD
ncbi:MAG: DUF4160 domain-containing protein [Desulfobacteraceae bacterium]